MSADDEIRREIVRLEKMTDDVFVDVVLEAQRSIVEGSELTGAPGQPVDTGNLKSSWIADLDPSATVATISTNVEYAQPIEDGVGRYGPMTLRSAVGGFHSVEHTIQGMPNIAAAVVARHAPNGELP
jgi:hypothetical protein